jgi:hypothetical protein
MESSLLPATSSRPSVENFTEKIPNEYAPSSQEKSKPSWNSVIFATDSDSEDPTLTILIIGDMLA